MYAKIAWLNGGKRPFSGDERERERQGKKKRGGGGEGEKERDGDSRGSTRRLIHDEQSRRLFYPTGANSGIRELEPRSLQRDVRKVESICRCKTGWASAAAAASRKRRKEKKGNAEGQWERARGERCALVRGDGGVPKGRRSRRWKRDAAIRVRKIERGGTRPRERSRRTGGERKKERKRKRDRDRDSISRSASDGGLGDLGTAE